MNWRKVAPGVLRDENGNEIHRAATMDGARKVWRYRAARPGGNHYDGPNYIAPWRESQALAERDLL